MVCVYDAANNNQTFGEHNIFRLPKFINFKAIKTNKLYQFMSDVIPFFMIVCDLCVKGVVIAPSLLSS